MTVEDNDAGSTAQGGHISQCGDRTGGTCDLIGTSQRMPPDTGLARMLPVSHLEGKHCQIGFVVI